MRKRIALFANGWSGEFLQEIGKGIQDVASREDIDIFAFVNYTSHAESVENQNGEFNIFRLPELKDYDGAVILANTFNVQTEVDYVHRAVLEAGIPAISVEQKLEGIDYIGADDYSGMYELTSHLIEEHAVKTILFVGGMIEHAGSQIRLNAVRDAAKVHGLEVSDRNVIYGDFSAGPAIDRLQEWMEENPVVPEAIICANDVMAVGICDWLIRRGIDVPGQVKVTGFDGLRDALLNDPVITTVNREWFGMGIRCMENLLRKINHEEVEEFVEVNTSLVCGESCGCHILDKESKSEVHREVAEIKNFDGFACDQHFRRLYQVLRRVETAQQFNESISQFFLEEGWLEGDNVMLAFNPLFFISEEWEGMQTEGYPDEMDVLSYVHGGMTENIFRMPTSDVMALMATRSELPGAYIFAPIRVDDISFGFAIISRGLSITQKNVLYLWCRHMSQYIEQIKSNIKISRLTKRLEALSVTDGLTGVYNRTGCESIMYPAFINNQNLGGQSVLMIADVDRLKYINDNLGHSSGDVAITLSVEALKEALPSEFMIGRYGGDEFLVVGCVSEMMDFEPLLQKIDEAVVHQAQINHIDFELAISVGAIQLEKGEEPDIGSCIERADVKMYNTKKEHKSHLAGTK